MPEFEGQMLLVEGYDLRLARRLVSGVDVWLNNPVYPLEACGTSGMKAGINGVINLSVLDGWWGEGYDGKNGWAIKPASSALDEARRNREEARTLYEILQDHVHSALLQHRTGRLFAGMDHDGQALDGIDPAAFQCGAPGRRIPDQASTNRPRSNGGVMSS